MLSITHMLKLGEAEDLAVTTDYRAVLSEVLVERLNNKATDEILPGYPPVTRNVMR